jgi:hypothetical protein
MGRLDYLARRLADELASQGHDITYHVPETDDLWPIHIDVRVWPNGHHNRMLVVVPGHESDIETGVWTK